MIGPSVDDRCRPRRPGIPRHPERITASKNSGRWLLNPPPLVPLSYAFVPFVPFVPAPLNRSEPLDYALFLPPCFSKFFNSTFCLPLIILSFSVIPQHYYAISFYYEDRLARKLSRNFSTYLISTVNFFSFYKRIVLFY